MAEMPKDPFTYIGRLHRDATGRVVSMDVYYPDETNIQLDPDDRSKNEFVTFTTVIEL